MRNFTDVLKDYMMVFTNEVISKVSEEIGENPDKDTYLNPTRFNRRLEMTIRPAADVYNMQREEKVIENNLHPDKTLREAIQDRIAEVTEDVIYDIEKKHGQNPAENELQTYFDAREYKEYFLNALRAAAEDYNDQQDEPALAIAW